MSPPTWALGAILILVLAACTSAQPPPAGGCPKVAVLGELAELVRFRPGAGRDLTDVELQAKFSTLASGCRYDKQSVETEIDIEVEAVRGPAMGQNKATFQYFAAVTNPAGEIVAKETFDATVEFKGNATRLVVADQLTPRIPLADRNSGPNWGILLGLQLTDEQREWIRRRRSR